ncbi:MAG: bifunctional diaminohydroxyphosphoribosylaminopyrimidine deaminase/5-amino-6-(5-phosphoribosylamino)uracil reductase RibD [Thermoguttaceae bacterium]
MEQPELDIWHMERALELAIRGQGHVEPNPMVGCIIVQGAEIIGEGWHREFGGPHAEVEALRIAGGRAAGGTMFVTLEPCCHHGKTPPCTKAIIAAGIRRVVVAQRDPFPQVAGGGLAELQAAGIEVELGLIEAQGQRLNAPYLKLLSAGRPWVLAKWAMTVDGKTATYTGSSQWISSPESREIVHTLRGRVDAILVGRGTVRRDNPLLTARPQGVRTAVRVIADSRAALSSDSQLATTAREVPVLVAVSPEAHESDRRRLRKAGCEVLVCESESPGGRIDELLQELGRRRMTNVLVEGGGRLMGSLVDVRQIDEVHVFIAPKLVGGAFAGGPVGGEGIAEISQALSLETPAVKQIGPDVYMYARVVRPAK